MSLTKLFKLRSSSSYYLLKLFPFFFQLSFLFCLSDFAHSPGRTPEIPVGTIATGDDRGKLGRNCASSIRVHLYCLWSDMVGAGFISHWHHLTTHHRTASQLIFLREAARTAANCAEPIILAYGTCASAKVCRHSMPARGCGRLRFKCRPQLIT